VAEGGFRKPDGFADLVRSAGSETEATETARDASPELMPGEGADSVRAALADAERALGFDRRAAGRRRPRPAPPGRSPGEPAAPNWSFESAARRRGGRQRGGAPGTEETRPRRLGCRLPWDYSGRWSGPPKSGLV
jgi:hypothetical protein